MQRLGRNLGSYGGEIIDIGAVHRRGAAAAEKHGWTVQDMAREGDLALSALSRMAQGTSGKARGRNIYLSTGIHGDEPAGPLAMCELLEANDWPADVNLWICPCLNPAGFSLNRRENAQGKDLNRDYLHFETHEVVAHVSWLKAQPEFDLALCLHEDWEAHGFYLYELNPDNLPSLAGPMIEAVCPVCPIDLSEVIEGRPAKGGIICPSTDPLSRPQWPEAFWLLTHKTRLSYTLEAPSDYPLQTRVHALVAAVKAAIARF